MIDLSKATFIIPVRIESMDRAFNLRYVLGYLTRNLKTNIIVYESGPDKIADSIVNSVNPIFCKIQYHYEKTDSPCFHRTLLLNKMLNMCKTEVVINYDADIILKPETYLTAYNECLNGWDLIYPYFKGNSQYMVFRPGYNDDLTQDISVRHELRNSEYGHCQFFKRTSYISGGMENQNFKSYGPEDYERGERFIKLGYKVKWLDNHYVYHLEHERTPNSSRENPFFNDNVKLYETLKSMSKEELQKYYSNVEYTKTYLPKKIILITYSDHNYASQREKLVNRAFEIGTIDEHHKWTDSIIKQTDFYKENKDILDLKRGAGYWLWKPYIIKQALMGAKENDVFVYLDSGDWISSTFREYINRKMSDHDVLLTEGGFTNGQYTKYDVLSEMNAKGDHYINAIQVEAGIIIIRKTERTVNLISEWLRWCLMPGLITDEPSKKHLPEFIEHRHDQSILSILQVKYGLNKSNEIRQYINCNQNN